jgi:hypothetical protein
MVTKRFVAVVLGALVAASALPALETAIAPREARAADVVDDVQLGTELIATSDVELGRASIARGSVVSVRKLDREAGRLKSVDVELADGHVVAGVAASVIRASFRVGSQGDE